MTVIHDKFGGRVVQLYIPFEYNGKKIEAITLAPLLFGHTLRWNDGAWKTSVEFLTELAGVEELVIRSIRQIDADRVMEAFMSLLTPEIREDVANGRIPVKPEKPPEDRVDELTRQVAETVERVSTLTNGRGDDIPPHLGPGAPLPPPVDRNPGFDMSEEP